VTLFSFKAIALACIIAFSGCATVNNGGVATTKAKPDQPRKEEEWGVGEEVASGMIFGPFVIAFLPLGAIAWGIQSLSSAKRAEKFYVPAGYRQSGAQKWIASMAAGHKQRTIRTFRNGDEFWRVESEDTLIYARFHNGVTVQYSR
jgi:hypothetical protein